MSCRWWRAAVAASLGLVLFVSSAIACICLPAPHQSELQKEACCGPARGTTITAATSSCCKPVVAPTFTEAPSGISLTAPLGVRTALPAPTRSPGQVVPFSTAVLLPVTRPAVLRI